MIARHPLGDHDLIICAIHSLQSAPFHHTNYVVYRTGSFHPCSSTWKLLVHLMRRLPLSKYQRKLFWTWNRTSDLNMTHGFLTIIPCDRIRPNASRACRLTSTNLSEVGRPYVSALDASFSHACECCAKHSSLNYSNLTASLVQSGIPMPPIASKQYQPDVRTS